MPMYLSSELETLEMIFLTIFQAKWLQHLFTLFKISIFKLETHWSLVGGTYTIKSTRTGSSGDSSTLLNINKAHLLSRVIVMSN